MSDRVARIEREWKRLSPKGPVDAMGVSTRCRLISEHFLQATQESLEAFDLVPFEWEVLGMLLRRGAPHEAAAGVIARETGRSSASITHRIDKLETRGLVKRRSSKEDGRVVLARLTAKGKKLAAKAAGPRIEAAGEVASALSKAERKQLNGLLGKLLESLDPGGADDV